MQHRVSRIASFSLAACVPLLGLTVALGPPAGAAVAGSAPASARAAAMARALIKNLMIGQHGTDHQVPGSASGVTGQANVSSTNWSGYADVGANTYSSVSGNWVEPAATCGSTASYAAFWVGLDGYSSSTVEQDGTLIECMGGTAFYYSWWEMYPTNAIQIVSSAVAAGDAISASVVRTGTSYKLTLTDSTNPAASFTTTQACTSCVNSSAEWIAEAPSSGGGVLPLADFGSWTETGAAVSSTTTSGVISTFAWSKIKMVVPPAVKARTGALHVGGTKFKVTWVCC
jgi:hypothetical protein